MILGKMKLRQHLGLQELLPEKDQIFDFEEYQDDSSIDLDSISIPSKLAELVPYSLAKRYCLVPFKAEQGYLYVAMEDPLNLPAIEDLKMVSQMEVVPRLAHPEAIKNVIRQLYSNDIAERAIKDYQEEEHLAQSLEGMEVEYQMDGINNAPIVRLVNTIIEQAVLEKASDIHIEPFEKEIRVRFRIDGKLVYKLSTPRNTHGAILTRIKIIGQMNIAEMRLPQDGRVEQMIGGKIIDLRISILPTIYGEKAVIRILDRNNFLFSKEQLGFTPENLDKFNRLLKYPHGMILVTGPTGSGKSTTLYTMLNELNTHSDNIVTLEDPVEYTLEGINQVQVNITSGLTFAAGLRSILRQDPDIIMVGEIRDRETAEIAIRAAITGHLVLSTLHTNDSVSTLSRLMDMGMPSYLLASAIIGVISQKLLRRVCPQCGISYTPDEHELASLGIKGKSAIHLVKAVGCSYCNYTGYKGRVAVHEVLMISKKHRQLIHRNASLDEIRDYSLKNGLTILKEECIKLLYDGVTTLDEVIRATYNQDEDEVIR